MLLISWSEAPVERIWLISWVSGPVERSPAKIFETRFFAETLRPEPSTVLPPATIIHSPSEFFSIVKLSPTWSFQASAAVSLPSVKVSSSLAMPDWSKFSKSL